MRPASTGGRISVRNSSAYRFLGPSSQVWVDGFPRYREIIHKDGKVASKLTLAAADTPT